MRPQTIQIFLPAGDPRGMRVAEITTRIVRVIEVLYRESGHEHDLQLQLGWQGLSGAGCRFKTIHPTPRWAKALAWRRKWRTAVVRMCRRVGNSATVFKLS